MAFEQAGLRPFGTPTLFSDPAHLRRWGFIDSPIGSGNPGGLPVGYAIDEQHRDPNTGQISRAIGLTCAACHIGQLRYRGAAILVDGGPATIDVTGMASALGLAVAFTRYVPGRFDRFAQRMLGPRATPAARAELDRGLDVALATFKALADLDN